MHDAWFVLLFLVLLFITSGLGILLYHWLKHEKQGYPNEDEIEAAVLPLIYKAIMAAYKMSERIIDSGQERLRGLDKKLIADALYDMMPASILWRGMNISTGWIKSLVPRAVFQAWVQKAFNDFLEWFDAVQEAYGDELLDLIGPE